MAGSMQVVQQFPMRGLVIQVERSGPAKTAPLDELIVAANPSKQLLWVRRGPESHGCLRTDNGVEVIERAEEPGQQRFSIISSPDQVYGVGSPYSEHTFLDRAVLLTSSTPTHYLWKHIMIRDLENRWAALHRVAQ